jgi:DNA-binding CsgD family transcriptional regulator
MVRLKKTGGFYYISGERHKKTQGTGADRLRESIYKPETIEQYFDHPEDFEPREAGASEEFGQLYFARIQRIPLLTQAEAQDLLERWDRFKDEKARERIINSHLRLVPPIARSTARKFAFEPNWNMLPSGPVKQAAFTGYREVVSELTAEGNLALVNATVHYKLDRGAVFYTYARKCVGRAIVHRAKALRTNVDRPFNHPAPWDLSIDPARPDVHDTRNYVGSRANPTVSDDLEEGDIPGDTARSNMSRLRALPQEPHVTFDDGQLTNEEMCVIRARMQGQKLKEIATGLGMSIATTWRRERSAVEKLRI